jgi:SPP1 family phage portal protein
MIYKFEDNNLSMDQVQKLYEAFKADDFVRFIDIESYYRGRNKDILNKSILGIKEAELSRIPVPYARKIINTVVGYMYHSNAIDYSFEDGNDETKQVIQDIFDANDEDVLIGEIGKMASIYGIGYEMIYLDTDASVRLCCPETIEIIPFFNYDIEPKLLGFLRWITQGDNILIDCYTQTEVKHFIIDKDKKISTNGIDPNLLDIIPLNIYKNNKEQFGDYEFVLKLIEAYDNLVSSCNDELKRWALAYLVLFGFKMTSEQIENIKTNRSFMGLDKNTEDVKFLTKDINTQFIIAFKDWLREEINLQTHVPDFLKLRTGEASSGASIDRLLYDFEFLCAVKEAYFRKGIYSRLEAIAQIEGLPEGIKSIVTVTFSRNKPSDSQLNSTLFNAYWGKLSDETVITNFAPFVDDPVAELETAQEEKQGRLEAYSSFAFGKGNGDSSAGDSSDDSASDSTSMIKKKPVFVA